MTLLALARPSQGFCLCLCRGFVRDVEVLYEGHKSMGGAREWTERGRVRGSYRFNTRRSFKGEISGIQAVHS